jgi:hypothetical protein
VVSYLSGMEFVEVPAHTADAINAFLETSTGGPWIPVQ